MEGMGKFEKGAKAVNKGRHGSLGAEGRGIKKRKNLEERKKGDRERKIWTLAKGERRKEGRTVY
jgi:hypothetical protein